MPTTTAASLSYRAVAQRVAGLNHEVLDDAVEYDVIVVAVAAVRSEVFHCLGALLLERQG